MAVLHGEDIGDAYEDIMELAPDRVVTVLRRLLPRLWVLKQDCCEQ